MIAPLALAFGLAACASLPTSLPEDQKLHLRSAAADYEVLGLDKKIEVREDGRRTPRSPEFFEWWYFDGLLDDGTIVVIWFGDNWLYGSHQRAVNIECTRPGGATERILRKFEAPGDFAGDQADIKIGPHSFRGDLDTYTIHVDAKETGGLGCDLTLQRVAPSYRPGTGYISAGDRFFAWLVAVPEGRISGTLTADGVTRSVAGSGYHDHNWGNISPAKLFDDWWWGRAQAGPHTVIASVIHGKPGVGGGSVTTFFVGDRQKTEVDAAGGQVVATEGGPVAHPDPRHSRPIPAGVSFFADTGAAVSFKLSTHVLTSSDLLADQGWPLRAAAKILGMKPWYTRFESPVSLTLPGEDAILGDGTLEYFELK